MIERGELLRLMVCPACRAPLEAFSHCTHCGATYSESDGTPTLFPIGANRTVTFQFDQSRSVRRDQFRNSFVYPPRRGAAGHNKPYHLDLAHLDILDLLPDKSTILEIGCGGGQMRQFLQSRGHRYIGIDLSKTRVSEDLRRHGGPDLLCDAHFLPFADRSFDLVYSAAVTEHLACPYLVAQEVARALKPGGFYLGNVAFLEPWHDDSFFHMSPLGVFELLTQAGFDIMHIWPGQGYSGFRAILNMGNKATRPLTFLGDAMYFIYRFGNRIRNLVKGRDGWTTDTIADSARVSGATDWIARRRFE
jgi:SAM-dependent methyltransferase